VHVSSELPIGGDQEEPVFEEDFTQLVEEGKWLSPLHYLFEPMSLHVKTKFIIPVVMHKFDGQTPS
jgi:hypothetical protein